MLLERLEKENEEQYLWRLGQAKDSGVPDLNWDDIADLMNKEFRDDISEYRMADAYRKPYQQAKRFYEAGAFNSDSNDDYIAELREQKQEIKKEKQKLFDERTALNKTLRDNARVEEDLARLESLIRKTGEATMPEIYPNEVVTPSETDLIISLSDFHLGMDVDNYFGKYNSEVAERRLYEYTRKILDIKGLQNAENAYVFLLGDMINGEIHTTTQLENRENIVEQVQKTAELLSEFVYQLSPHFENVYIDNVSGNHSRTSCYKDQVLRSNRLDNLIPWYMKAKLSHINKVQFIEDNYDSTIGRCVIRGKEYWLVHGDFDSYSEQGVSKLIMMIGCKPEAIFYGHLHRCSYDDIAGVKIIRSGGFSGTCDDFTVSKRLCGHPSQMVCAVNVHGVNACYPVNLA